MFYIESKTKSITNNNPLAVTTQNQWWSEATHFSQRINTLHASRRYNDALFCIIKTLVHVKGCPQAAQAEEFIRATFESSKAAYCIKTWKEVTDLSNLWSSVDDYCSIILKPQKQDFASLDYPVLVMSGYRELLAVFSKLESSSFPVQCARKEILETSIRKLRNWCRFSIRALRFDNDKDGNPIAFNCYGIKRKKANTRPALDFVAMWLDCIEFAKLDKQKYVLQNHLEEYAKQVLSPIKRRLLKRRSTTPKSGKYFTYLQSLLN